MAANTIFKPYGTVFKIPEQNRIGVLEYIGFCPLVDFIETVDDITDVSYFEENDPSFIDTALSAIKTTPTVNPDTFSFNPNICDEGAYLFKYSYTNLDSIPQEMFSVIVVLPEVINTGQNASVTLHNQDQTQDLATLIGNGSPLTFGRFVKISGPDRGEFNATLGTFYPQNIVEGDVFVYRYYTPPLSYANQWIVQKGDNESIEVAPEYNDVTITAVAAPQQADYTPDPITINLGSFMVSEQGSGGLLVYFDNIQFTGISAPITVEFSWSNSYGGLGYYVGPTPLDPNLGNNYFYTSEINDVSILGSGNPSGLTQSPHTGTQQVTINNGEYLCICGLYTGVQEDYIVTAINKSDNDTQLFQIDVRVQPYAGCFLTTAVVDYMGKDDDGPELAAMRQLRERYLEEDRELIAEYVNFAPIIIENVVAAKAEEEVWTYVYAEVINVMEAISEERWEDARQIYKDMYIHIRNIWV